MSEESTLFHFFKKNNIFVYSIQKDLTSQDISVKLTEKEVKQNQDRLMDIFGKSHHLEKIKHLLTL